ncbi:Zinc/iron permease [Zychaea mexicana]|uniref:Zinc/iron permease n=1 Tax=Zychaea mexicana TaxID=64656 RepID=UPI0022FE9FF9|nr:Zinc/iron permease [Zychaea mexicana]KAI9493665.1 Zinc/iron permease [Zychaea mexicana]
MENFAFSFLLFWAFLPLVVRAQEAEGAEEESCARESLDDYNMPLRIGSLFIILVTSAVGTFVPMLLHRIHPYSEGSFRYWVLTVGKFFGTGVILATAFIHMLPESLENFSSPCLSEGWQSYGAFAGIFCMISSFALQLLELGAATYMDKLRAKRQNSAEASFNEDDMEKKTGLEHGHVHGGALFEEDEKAFRNVGVMMLELGIVMHSIIIGITLANTGNDEFVTLIIALVFHQFFEGIALGTRINEMEHKSWVRPLILGGLFIIMTPIGVAIGIGIHSSFNPNSSSSVLANAVLDSLSAGILLYNAYVSLMSAEINHNLKFRQSSLTNKAVCFLSMYIGAGLMALIGKWA